MDLQAGQCVPGKSVGLSLTQLASAALQRLGCSLAVTVAPVMPPAPSPAPHTHFLVLALYTANSAVATVLQLSIQAVWCIDGSSDQPAGPRKSFPVQSLKQPRKPGGGAVKKGH